MTDRVPKIGSVLLRGAVWLTATAALSAQALVVLPFANRTPSGTTAGKLDWIGESVAETVRDAAEGKGVLTVSREEVEEATRQLGLRSYVQLTQASAIKIGETLDAEYVLMGTFEFVPDGTTGETSPRGTLNISARLADRRHLRLGPEFMETGNLDDLLILEAHLTWRTLSLVAPDRAPPESNYRALRAAVRLDAEESYVRGLLSKSETERERFFLQATRLDPKFAHANLALGRIHYERKEYRQAADWLQKLAPEDAHYRDASFLLGLALFQSSDFGGAQKAFQSVADVVPLGVVLNDLGAAQSRQGLPQALDSFRNALAGDASDSVYHFNVGYALWKRGEFTAAVDRFRAVLDRQPDDQSATLLLGMCLKKQGPRPGDARLESLERLKSNYEERAYMQLKELVRPSN